MKIKTGKYKNTSQAYLELEEGNRFMIKHLSEKQVITLIKNLEIIRDRMKKENKNE